MGRLEGSESRSVSARLGLGGQDLGVPHPLNTGPLGCGCRAPRARQSGKRQSWGSLESWSCPTTPGSPAPVLDPGPGSLHHTWTPCSGSGRGRKGHWSGSGRATIVAAHTCPASSELPQHRRPMKRASPLPWSEQGLEPQGCSGRGPGGLQPRAERDSNQGYESGLALHSATVSRATLDEESRSLDPA